MAVNLIDSNDIKVIQSDDDIELQTDKTTLNNIINNKIKNSNTSSTTDTYSCDYIDNLKETYSTSETLTNKIWIDSKPIYRKVVQFTVASAEVAWKSAPHGIQNANASSMRIVEAYIAVNAFGIVNEFVPNQTFQLGIADTNIRYVNHKSESNFDNKTCTCIIEYTKTTD